jgi:hypothetical protein
MAEYEQAYDERILQNFMCKAKVLGHRLLPTPNPASPEALT